VTSIIGRRCSVSAILATFTNVTTDLLTFLLAYMCCIVNNELMIMISLLLLTIMMMVMVMTAVCAGNCVCGECYVT